MGIYFVTYFSCTGTASAAGAHGAGTVFKMTPSGTLTTLYSFCPEGSPCVDVKNRMPR